MNTKTDREKAMDWWNELHYSEKEKHRFTLSVYTSSDSPIDPITFPDEEILERIWEKETQN